jgi:polysaccharide deacetylase family protein (PEP-CTERM system associated)
MRYVPALMMGTSVRHLFTVDVEDYFHSEDPDRGAWDRHELRVEGSTRAILECCAAAGRRGTFFVLGWLAERRPQLVREIANAGHEVASHGYSHQFVYRQSRAEFLDDVRRTRELLSEITGAAVNGYRAPYFSVVTSTPWAHDALLEAGYTYSSSVFPGMNPRYGIPGAGQEAWSVPTGAHGSLLEIPITTFWSRVGCGGVYFRALPYALFRAGIAARERAGKRVVFYLHPWELDAGKPSPNGSAGLRWRHDVGVAGARGRLERLLAEFEFESVEDSLTRERTPQAAREIPRTAATPREALS